MRLLTWPTPQDHKWLLGPLIDGAPRSWECQALRQEAENLLHAVSLMSICLRPTFSGQTSGLKLFNSRVTKSWSIFVWLSCSRLSKHVSERDALYSWVSIKTPLANREGKHRIMTRAWSFGVVVVTAVWGHCLHRKSQLHWLT